MPTPPPLPESPEEGTGKETVFFEYNLAAIRQLLLNSFSAKELRRFCQDRMAFRPIVADFGPGANKNDMVDRMLEHCETRLLFDSLLHEVAQARPRMYERFEPQLRHSRPSPPEGTEPRDTEKS